jgi:hypothetical protein
MLNYLPYRCLGLIHEERIQAALASNRAYAWSDESGPGASNRRSLLAWVRSRLAALHGRPPRADFGVNNAFEVPPSASGDKLPTMSDPGG